jgi:hypothetical protein
MKGKKTVEVSVMLDWANAQLARTDVEANASYKAGICDMLYVVLSKSNNYKGFRYVKISMRITADDYKKRLEEFKKLNNIVVGTN